MSNRLANATSPYLRQHKDNPVDWFEWGEDAFDEARARDVPVLLSVGYAACHWCHVMAHESFEDASTAAVMNKNFVNIKVDREERPDIDGIYMEALQAMSGHGGWPMTMFLDADGRPFFAGTYFPPTDRSGHPSFRRVLDATYRMWTENRSAVIEQAGKLVKALQIQPPPAAINDSAVDTVALMGILVRRFDSTNGGFGGAPKFPQVPMLDLLAAIAATDGTKTDSQAMSMLSKTLHTMAASGLNDHIDGGFARYSVDEQWRIPHFEKMLYDNALLANIYLAGWQLTGDEVFRRVCMDTLDYMLTDLRDPSGALWSSEDADAQGVEGRFALWSIEELRLLLSDQELDLSRTWFGVTDGGNFEGMNHLYLPHGMPAEDPEEVSSLRATLKETRDKRVRPGVDDKIVTEWNCLAMRSLAQAGAAFGERKYVDAAESICTFIRDHLTVAGSLQRSARGGRTSGPAFAEDFGAYAGGLFAVALATHNPAYYDSGLEAVDELIDRFVDPHGGVYRTAHDGEDLIVRQKPLFDNPTPSPQTLALDAITTAYALTGRPRYAEALAGVRRTLGSIMADYPTAAAGAMAIMVGSGDNPAQLALVGNHHGVSEMLSSVLSEFRPWIVIAATSQESQLELFADRMPPPGLALGYLCHDFVCELPVDSAQALHKVLAAAAPKASE